MRTADSNKQVENGPRPESDKQATWIACGIFVLALSIRLLYLYESSDNPSFAVPIVDARGYDLIARQFVEQGKMPEGFFWQQFFYPCFLSVVYFFSSCSVVAVQVVQALLGAITCVLTFFVGRAVFNRRTGILAGLFVVFYGPLIFHELDLIAVGWAAFWSLVLILLFLKAADKKRWFGFFLLGLCGALSVITRPNFLPYFLVGCAWLLFVFTKARERWSSQAKSFCLIALGFSLVALPVAIENRRVTGHFSILPASGGINLYIGNNPDFEAAEIRPGLMWERLVGLPAKHGVAGDMWKKQEFFYEKTREFIASDPVRFVKGLGIKALQFVCSREIPGDVDIYLFRRWSILLELLMWRIEGLGFPFGVLLPLSIIGFVYSRRARLMPVTAFVIIYPLMIILTHVKTRYRVPMVPVLSILAAAGCIHLVRAAGQRNGIRLATALLLGIAVVLLSSLPGPFIAEELEYEAELYLNIGTTLTGQGKIQEAVASYEKALALKPGCSEAYHNLGVILYGQGRVDDAVEHFRRAVELEPADFRAHCGLGTALYRLGRFEDAQKHFQEAVKIKPDYSLAHKNLAAELARQGKLEQAISHYEEAVKLEPDDADAHKELGVVLARQDKYDEAIKHLQEAIRIRPGFGAAHKSLGTAMAFAGKLDDAIGQYHKALEIEPNDADTHFFLGLVLAQKKDLESAVKEFRAALLINPNHAAARANLDALLKASRR